MATSWRRPTRRSAGYQGARAAGVASDTLVIFTSDNGPEVTGEVNPGVDDRAKRFQHFSMGPLRGTSATSGKGDIAYPS